MKEEKENEEDRKVRRDSIVGCSLKFLFVLPSNEKTQRDEAKRKAKEPI
jgi:hypothetical protein